MNSLVKGFTFVVSTLVCNIALAQNGSMMNHSGWGQGWMYGYGGLSGGQG